MISNPVSAAPRCKCCGPVACIEKHVREHVQRILTIRGSADFPAVTTITLSQIVECFVDVESDVYPKVCKIMLYK
jgi:hypothetical protein